MSDQAPEATLDLEDARSALPEHLRRIPVIDAMPERLVQLLKARLAAAAKTQADVPTHDEVGAWLEIAAAYALDPFSGEIWLAKSRGRVLIMVGRDGLRKIAHRSGLHLEGDVIHEHDAFRVERGQGGRMVDHSYGHPKERGPIVGAWVQVRDAQANECGFFVATVDEYKPTSEDQLRYSPWGSQESVMILAAAERQALRQATPLSGLVAQGELDRGEEAEAGAIEAAPDWSDVPLAEEVQRAIERARLLGHQGYADAGTALVMLSGQSEEFVRTWLAAAYAELEQMQQERERRVLGDPPARTAAEAGTGDPQADAAKAADLRAQADELVAEAAGIEDPATAGEIEAQAEALYAEANSIDPGDVGPEF